MFLKFKEAFSYCNVICFIIGIFCLVLLSAGLYDKYILWQDRKIFLFDRAAINLSILLLFLVVPTYFIIKDKLFKKALFTTFYLACYFGLFAILHNFCWIYFLGKE
ncbi:MAG: hypothetical protein RLZZ81_47 [Pseudomonadota bacterium]|jgi:uncharacterized membrane protein